MIIEPFHELDNLAKDIRDIVPNEHPDLYIVHTDHKLTFSGLLMYANQNTNPTLFHNLETRHIH